MEFIRGFRSRARRLSWLTLLLCLFALRADAGDIRRDLDGDGRKDIVAVEDGRSVTITLSSVGRSFTVRTSGTILSVAAADINADRRLDLVIFDSHDGISVWRQRRNGSLRRVAPKRRPAPIAGPQVPRGTLDESPDRPIAATTDNARADRASAASTCECHALPSTIEIEWPESRFPAADFTGAPTQPRAPPSLA